MTAGTVETEHGGSAMACQVFRWLLAGAGPTSFQHALVGMGCLLAFDVASRWWRRRPNEKSGQPSDRGASQEGQRRRAA